MSKTFQIVSPENFDIRMPREIVPIFDGTFSVADFMLRMGHLPIYTELTLEEVDPENIENPSKTTLLNGALVYHHEDRIVEHADTNVMRELTPGESIVFSKLILPPNRVQGYSALLQGTDSEDLVNSAHRYAMSIRKSLMDKSENLKNIRNTGYVFIDLV